jgi:hypothetical protein
MNKAQQTFADMQSVAGAEPLAEAVYDPVRERLAARRLKGARWRRLVLFFSAILVAGAAAGGFTLANRDALLAAIPAAEPSTPTAVAPEPSAPSLASATSRSVQLPGLATPDSDPNKVQARVVIPADPEPQSAAAPASPAAPIQMQDSQSAGAPRAIPLGGGRLAVTASSEPAPALHSGALGFAAPVPAPRPSSAP